jgi:hypothetical protein
MSVDSRGEHEQQVWLSDQDIDALVIAIEQVLEAKPRLLIIKRMSARLSRLSVLLHENRP